MKASDTIAKSAYTTTLVCDVLAHAAVRALPEQIPPMRRNPGTAPNKAFSFALLRPADDQTVVGIVAALKAIEAHGLTGTDFSNWGVLASPQFLGRTAIVGSIVKFLEEGAWGISPHVVPHRLLHAVSGTLSQVLGIHGVNYGVGGGPIGIEEAMLTALTLINTEKLPGLWLVQSGHNPEPVVDDKANVTAPGICQAIALALVPAQVGWTGLRLRLTPAESVACAEGRELLTHETVRDALAAPMPPRMGLTWNLGPFGILELLRPAESRRAQAGAQQQPQTTAGRAVATAAMPKGGVL